jgi:hypothetical protein
MVIVPLRGGPALSVTSKVTVPGPVPLPPPVIASQVADDAAVHGHVAPVAMLTEPVPPAAGIA